MRTRPARRGAAAVAATATALALLSACSGASTPPEDGTSPGPATGDAPEDAGDAGHGSWSVAAPMPQRRTELSATAYDGAVYVAGGFSATVSLPTEFYRYDPVSDTWDELAPIPEERHHAPLVAHDGRLYLVAGYDGDHPWSRHDTLFIYDVADDTWHEGPALPERVGAHAAVVTSTGVLHVVGGVAAGGVAQPWHFALDLATGQWSEAPPMPTAREHLGAAYHDGTIYVAAGRAGNVSDLRTFEAYDLDSRQWRTLADLPTGRSGVAVTAYQGQVYVFGGETFGPNRTYDAAERYDPATDTWQELAGMPTARHGLGAGVVDDMIVVVSGGPRAGLTYSDVTEVWRP